jgi:hypothetical protein
MTIIRAKRRSSVVVLSEGEATWKAPELLTVREVATLLKISPESVTRKFQDL